MLPLLASRPPESREILLNNLEAGLTDAFHTPARIDSTLDTLHIRLDAPQLSQLPKFPACRIPADASPQLSLKLFHLEARNALFLNTPFSFECRFEDAPFFWMQGTETHSALALENPRAGEIRVQFLPGDLEKLVALHLSQLAESQGFELQECALALTPCTPAAPGLPHRGIEVQLQLKAGAFLMAAALTLSGRVRITDDLHLAFENLSCKGTGMAASAAKAFLAPQFKRLESQPFPISSVLPPGLPLQSAGWEFLPNPDRLGLVAAFAGNTGENARD
jgi:hypothetical protein